MSERIEVHAFDCPHYDQTRPQWLLALVPCTCHDEARMSEKPAPRKVR